MKKLALAIFLALLLAVTFAAFYRHQTQLATDAAPLTDAAASSLRLKLSTRLSAPGERRLSAAPPAVAAAPANPWLLISMSFLGAATLLGIGAGWLLRPSRPRTRDELQDELNSAQTHLRDEISVGDELREQIRSVSGDVQASAERLAASEALIGELRAELADTATTGREQLGALSESRDALKKELEEMRSRLQDGDNLIGDLRGELHDSEQESQRQATLAAEKDALNASLQTELDELAPFRQQAHDTEARLETARKETRTLESQIEELRQDLVHSDERGRHDIEQLQKRHSEYEASLAERDEAIDELQLEITRQQEQLRASEESHATVRQALNDATRELEERAASADELRQNLAGVNEQTQHLEVQIRERDGQILALTDELSHANQREQELATSLAKVQQEIETVQTSLDTSSERAMLLQTELGQQQDASRELQTQIANRDSEIESLSATLEASTTQVSELAGIRARLDAWRSTVDTFERDLRERDKRIGTLAGELDELLGVRAEMTALRDELDAANRTIAEQNAAGQELETQLSDEISSAAQLRSRFEALELHNVETQAVLDEQIHAGQQLRERVASLNVSLYEMELTAVSRGEQVATLLEAGERDAQRIRRLEDDVEHWQDALPPVETRNQVLTESIASLRNDMAAMLQHDEEMQAAARDQQRQLECKDDEAQSREQKIGELTIELETERFTVAELNKQIRELAAARTQLAEWRSTIDTFRNEVRNKTSQIDELNDALDALGKENRQLRDETSRVAELEADIEQKTALAKVLKEGTDSMRGYKVTATQQSLELEQLRSEIERLGDELNDSAAALDTERSSAATLQGQADQQRERIESLLLSVQDKDHQFEQLSAEKDAAVAELDTERSSAATLQGQADQQRERIESLLLSVQDKDHQFEQLSAEKDAAVNALDAEQSAAEGYQQRIRDLESAEQELAASLLEKASELATLDDKLQLTRRDYSDLQERADKSSDALARFGDELRDLDEHSGRMAELLATPLPDLSSDLPDRDALDIESGDTHELIQATMSSVRAQFEELSSADAAAQQLTAELHTERATNTSLRADLERALAARDDLHQQAIQQEAMADEFDQIVALNRQLSEDVEALQENFRQQQTQAQGANDRVNELEQHLQQLQQYSDGLETQQTVERELSEQLGSEIAALREKDEITAERLATLRDIEERAGKLQDDVEHLQEGVIDRQRAVDAMLDEIGDITHQKVTQDTWRHELAALVRNLGNKDVRIDELAQQTVALREQLETLGHEHSEQSNNLYNANAEIRKENARLEDQLIAQTNSNRELQEIIAQRERALAELRAKAATSAASVPVLRDALHNAPPVLTAAVASTREENEENEENEESKDKSTI